MTTAHVAEDDRLEAYAPMAWARCITDVAESINPSAIVAAGTNRGNEVMAHVAARLDLPFAANCTKAEAGRHSHEDPLGRQPPRGSTTCTRAPPHRCRQRPHAVAGGDGERRRRPAVDRFEPSLDEADLAVQVKERVEAETNGISLAEAKVVISGGRGVGSADGFGILEELAGASERGGRLLARGHQRGLAPAHRPGRPDRHQGLARPLHRVRHQRRHAAHRRLQGREEDPRDQLRRRGADPRTTPTTR